MEVPSGVSLIVHSGISPGIALGFFFRVFFRIFFNIFKQFLHKLFENLNLGIFQEIFQLIATNGSPIFPDIISKIPHKIHFVKFFTGPKELTVANRTLPVLFCFCRVSFRN